MINEQKARDDVFALVKELFEDNEVEEEVNDSTQLLGGDSELDSMNLVELCVSLEDVATDLGFEFDWTSENAMSKSRGMFATVGSLTLEFLEQYKKKT